MPTGCVVGIELIAEEDESGQPPDHCRNLACFFLGEWSAQNRFLSIGESFLDNEIASDDMVPSRLRYAAPEGPAVQIDVDGRPKQGKAPSLVDALGGKSRP